MSKILSFSMANNLVKAYADAVAGGNAFDGYGVAYRTVSEAILGDLSRAAGVMVNRYPDAAMLAVQSSLQAAANNAQAAQNPIIPGSLEFSLAATTPASIARGATGTCTVTMALVDPSWSGTVTFTGADLSGQSITVTFSGTLTAAGTVTATVHVPVGADGGAHLVEIIGTDTFPLSNGVVVTVTVT